MSIAMLYSFVAQVLLQLNAIGCGGVPFSSTVGIGMHQSTYTCTQCNSLDNILSSYCIRCRGSNCLLYNTSLSWQLDELDSGVDMDETEAAEPSDITFADSNPIHHNLLLHNNEELNAHHRANAVNYKLEVRAIPSLSRCGQPCQLGVVNADDDIPADVNLMYFGGLIIDTDDPHMIKSGTTYAKAIAGSSGQQAFDGKPVADMYRRIIPQSQSQVDGLDRHATAVFTPNPSTNPALTPAHMAVFNSQPFGFMVNCARGRCKEDKPMTSNCRWMIQIKDAISGGIQIPLLRSTKMIATGDELVVADYNNNDSRAGFITEPIIVRDVSRITAARNATSIRAIEYLGSLFKKNKKCFDQHSGDIIFLLRNVIFNASGVVSVSHWLHLRQSARDVR